MVSSNILLSLKIHLRKQEIFVEKMYLISDQLLSLAMAMLINKTIRFKCSLKYQIVLQFLNAQFIFFIFFFLDIDLFIFFL